MTSPCPEDLLGLRRIGPLDAAEAWRLDGHLQSCADCALDESLHESFAKDGRPRTNDTALIARVLDRTVSRRLHRRPRRSRSLVAGMAAAVVLVAGLASAAVWLSTRTTSPVRSASGTVSAPSTRPAKPAPQSLALEPPAAAPTESAPVEPPRTPSTRPHSPRRPLAPEPPPVAPALDRTAIFAAANEARRAGQPDRAGALYAELQRRFPDSREAQLSLVSYGRILFDQGRAAEALAQFQRHLQAEGGGMLAAEALFGQARALTRLHRDDEARRCWADLLARFPDSIFADVARAQLGAKP